MVCGHCPPYIFTVQFSSQEMVRINIVHELQESNMVESFAEKLRQNGDEVMLACGDRFPTGDAIFGFLYRLSSKFDKTFIIISGQPDSILSIWISKELVIQQSLGNFTNIYPTFFTFNDIQPWWTAHEKVVILSHTEG
jgi:hypothetical protein